MVLKQKQTTGKAVGDAPQLARQAGQALAKFKRSLKLYGQAESPMEITNLYKREMLPLARDIYALCGAINQISANTQSTMYNLADAYIDFKAQSSGDKARIFMMGQTFAVQATQLLKGANLDKRLQQKSAPALPTARAKFRNGFVAGFRRGQRERAKALRMKAAKGLDLETLKSKIRSAASRVRVLAAGLAKGLKPPKS